MHKRATSLFITSLFGALLVSTSLIPFAHAVSPSDWKPGRIIDDSIFSNKDSMSVTQIQDFLNAHVGTGGYGKTAGQCDTNGTATSELGGGTRAQYGEAHGNPAPFTCLKDYYEVPKLTPGAGIPASNYGGAPIPDGAKSAAQLIWDAAQRNNISPKVLLVTIQKESAGPLTTDDWPFKKQYTYAMGAHCPDSGPNGSANCDPNYAGFSIQISESAALFRYYLDNMYQSWWPYKKVGVNQIQYNPSSACGSSDVNIVTMATAALYTYTPYQPNAEALAAGYGTGNSCSSYGNRNFWLKYNEWFGSTQLAPSECDSKISGITCVWGLIKSDGSQFLTTSKSERDITINNYGWIYEGVAFYASDSQRPGTIPTYRLRQGNQHYYTADKPDYDSKIASGNWSDEGIAFYAYPPTTSTNMSHTVYRMHNSSLNRYYLTADDYKKSSLIKMGYTVEQNTFSTFSGLADLPQPAAGRVNVYRLQNKGSYFYTSSLSELESVVRSGYSYEGVLTSSSANGSGTPAYRLQRNGSYFYTADPNERSSATQNYGMSDEGVGFYVDDNSDQVYRMLNTIGNRYFYTSNASEALLIANTNGWQYEGILSSSSLTTAPVYRFINQYNNRHFYTINIYEAARITNKNWKYEGVAFSALTGSGLPIYRLRLNDTYLLTANSNEKDIAVSKYGYAYEGIAYYASQTATNLPAYRLQKSGEYFYTISSAEKDTAVNRYGYRYEGEGFYLPSGN